MAKITQIIAREILDSRGWPTVEVDVRLDDGVLGRAAVPSGASTGEHEAVELRDGDPKRYLGKGTLKAAANAAGVLGQALRGAQAADQEALDEKLISVDGSPNKGRLGANALLGVSMAASRAAALSARKSLLSHLRDAFSLSKIEPVLPTPMFNIVNGGKHADSGLDVQEFMVVPVGAASFGEALRMGVEVYQALKKILALRGLSTAVGDEGGFAPRVSAHQEALDLIMEAVSKSGFESKVALALDAAASEFYREGRYLFEKGELSPSELIDRYAGWSKAYPILSFEDPLAEDDWTAWGAMTARLGSKVRIVGDDLFVTNLPRLERGIREKSANAILIKLNQIGTVTETVRAVLAARKAGFSAIISHRSGETEDPYIADLSVALGAGAIKTGAPCRSERLAKYNQLLRIQEELGALARYAGPLAFGPLRK